MKKTAVLCLGMLAIASLISAKTVERTPPQITLPVITTDHDAWLALGNHDKAPRVPAQLDTIWLIGPGGQAGEGTFDGAGGCETEGWTWYDWTAQPDNYWHVDDFQDLTGIYGGFVPLEGSQSMWCGTRPDDNDPVKCSYVNLPGYGNNWNQWLVTKQCLEVSGDVDLSFQIFWTSEFDYDFTYIQWDECDDAWQDLVPGGLDGLGQWDTTFTVPDSLHSGSVRFRIWFKSDGAWSDEDGGGDTDGACTIDALAVNDAAGVVLAFEGFEDETVGDHDGNDWQSVVAAGYGELAALYPGHQLAQDDPCTFNTSCVWAFINGSTSDYSCGSPPHPEQATVPYENARGQHVDQDIWSPWLDITAGSGDIFELSYLVYADLLWGSGVFSDFSVRGIDSTAAVPCPTAWYRDYDYDWFPLKVWGPPTKQIGSLIPPGSTHIQVALRVVDFCQYGWFCAGACHSHAPLYDNVVVYRVSSQGPQFTIKDGAQFQDNFPEDGTVTGTARADMSGDLNRAEPAQAIVPGDSAVVSKVSDPAAGLDVEPNGRASVFFYASVDGPHAETAPGALVCDARYPYIEDVAAGGRTWHKYQADTCYAADGTAQEHSFNFDFCDGLFVPGDTIWFFWGARNTNQIETYCAATLATSGHQTGDIDEAAANADEFQILPAVGRDVQDGGRGGDILYVDGANFRGVQPYFDTAFQGLGIFDEIDRYDIRGTSNWKSNHPGSRVKSVQDQLVRIYKKIIWSCSNMDGFWIPWADGTGDNQDKSDDTGMVLAFLEFLDWGGGGIYLDGDNVATKWLEMNATSALDLRNVYMSYNVTATDHQPYVGYNPWVLGTAGGAFGGDSLVVKGGCPYPEYFDVLEGTVSSVVQMRYHNWVPRDSAFAPAILSQRTENDVGDTVGFILSGFSFEHIRDLEPGGVPARYRHMQHILEFLDNIVDQPVGSDAPQLTKNQLDQNMPNPFNPTTTITYQVKESGLVHLRIYNVAGQLVRTLVDGNRASGQLHEATWNGLNDHGKPVSSGVYFYKLVAKDFSQTKKMVLLK